MWGEIDPPVQTKPTLREVKEKEEERNEEEADEPVFPLQRCKNNGRLDTDSPPAAPLDFESESQCVRTMIMDVAMSGSPVKSQQLGDAELSLGERRGELLRQFRAKPLVFLERYHARLKPGHLPAFASVSSDARAQHYSRLVQRRAAGRSSKTLVRNHRYAALRALQKEGKYFSEEEMRRRAPLLYEQYIGQYLTDDEVIERSHEAMLDGSSEAQENAGGLANLLLNSYQERLLQSRLQEEQEREECAQEEEEEDEAEEEDGDSQQSDQAPTTEEKALLREEFVSQMHQRFLDGKDKDFNYSEVDDNPDYDNLDIVSRDAEEKYFDEDDDDGEEEEEEESEEKQEDENMAE